MLSQTAEYALRAMACLAMGGSVMTAPALAAQARIPATYLSKVLRMLSVAKLVRGRRGIGGGYELAKSSKEISLLQVIDAIDGVSTAGASELSRPKGDAAPRLNDLHGRIDEANQAFLEVLGSSTLHDVAVSRPGGSTRVAS